MKKTIYLLSIVVAFASCNEGAKESKTQSETKSLNQESEQCVYAYDHSTTELIWTAYKYNQRTGVKGTFDEIMVKGFDGKGALADVIMGGEVRINTSTVNSGDLTRDPKISEHFFGNLEGGDVLIMKAVGVTDNTVSFDITMNGKSQTIVGDFKLNDTELKLTAELDLNLWEAQGGVVALNKACEDLHKGADGESKLWPDVSVLITTQLRKECK